MSRASVANLSFQVHDDSLKMIFVISLWILHCNELWQKKVQLSLSMDSSCNNYFVNLKGTKAYEGMENWK